MNDTFNAGNVPPRKKFLCSKQGGISRRSFLALMISSFVAGCGPSQQPTIVPGTSTRTSAPFLQPTAPIAPDTARRVMQLAVLRLQAGQIRGLGWSPDGSFLAVGASPDVQLWNARTGKHVATLQGHTNQVYGTAWSPDGSMLATASQDGTVRLWNIQERRVLHVLRLSTTFWMISVAWSPDGHRLVSGDATGFVHVWDVRTGKRLVTWSGAPLGKQVALGNPYAVWGVTWAPDGKRIASTRYDGIVQVWAALEGDSAGEELAVLRTSSYPNGVAWSPDGRLLASTGDDGTVQVWTTTWKNSAVLDPHDRAGWTLAVTWSPDARMLAASREGHLVQLWDVRTGREVISLDGHTDEVWSTAWSPDGLRLASGSDDGTVRVWGVP
jgi:WD40 repeat protein